MQRRHLLWLIFCILEDKLEVKEAEREKKKKGKAGKEGNGKGKRNSRVEDVLSDL